MKSHVLKIIFLTFISFNISAAFSPIGFSFTSKGKYLNFPPQDWDVYGFRTNFFGGVNRRVVGFDVGGFNVTTEMFAGSQMGGVNVSVKDAYIVGFQTALLYNKNEGNTYVLGAQMGLFTNYNKGPATIVGAQFGLVNVGKKTNVYGVQMGAYNTANRVVGSQFGVANASNDGTIYGYQLGVYNRALRVVGFQLGILNYADNLHGIQLGLLNICKSCAIGIMPGVNIGF